MELSGGRLADGRYRGPVGEQFHFDPATYLEMVQAEVPAYERFQDAVADATLGVEATRLLDLGVGTGETLRRVAERHPRAALFGLDESDGMLATARCVVPQATLHVARLEAALPAGPFDLVVSALAVHHLDGQGKADLFRRVAAILTPGGRFVLGDVVVPEDPADVVTPIDGEYDKPDRVDAQVQWMVDAGFSVSIAWAERDLAVLKSELA
ncbi:MAG: hypothetical protein QOI55_953 [Actinomycetota bacterium]|nr:hypothetical protein [Actinomycetota bacterium]